MPDPYVDPEMPAILAANAERMRGLPNYENVPIAEGRAIFSKLHAHWNEPKIAMRRTVDLTVPGSDGPIRARYYTPGQECVGLVIYLHGGGWTFGDIDSHDRACRLLARESGACVLSVDYRLAPEHPFPAGLEDTLAVLRWLREDSELPAIRHRIALAGDSSGANLAMAAMLSLRASGARQPEAAALFYGVFQVDWNTGSHRAFGDGRWGLSTTRMGWYAANYLGERPELAVDPLVSPALADPAGLPPVFLNAAGLDPLLDDTLAVAGRLAAAHVPHTLRIYPGVIHGFMQMSSELAAARQAFADAGAWLRAKLTAP